jgi:hypothetical protein
VGVGSVSTLPSPTVDGGVGRGGEGRGGGEESDAADNENLSLGREGEWECWFDFSLGKVIGSCSYMQVRVQVRVQPRA